MALVTVFVEVQLKYSKLLYAQLSMVGCEENQVTQKYLHIENKPTYDHDIDHDTDCDTECDTDYDYDNNDCYNQVSYQYVNEIDIKRE